MLTHMLMAIIGLMVHMLEAIIDLILMEQFEIIILIKGIQILTQAKKAQTNIEAIDQVSIITAIN